MSHGEIDGRRTARIATAVSTAAAAMLSHGVGINEALAMLKAAMKAAAPIDASAREIVSLARQARRKEMLAALRHLEAAGKGRRAAGIVARKFADDPRDPLELTSLASQLRRWRREEKADSCPNLDPQTDIGSAHDDEASNRPGHSRAHRRRDRTAARSAK